MGNNNILSDQKQLPVNFKQLKQQKHAILGEIKHIMNTHDDSHFIMLQRVFASSSDFETSLKKVKNRCRLAKMKQKYLPNQFIIEMLDYRTAQYSQFCGKTFKIFIFIKSFDSGLKATFKQRQKSSQHYTQDQLIQFMLKTSNCLIELYDHNIKPFHLSMESIICRNNSIKIIDRQLTNQMSPIDSLNYRAELTSGTYIAPEMLSQSFEYSANMSKSDIFCLGMLVLEMATLKNLDQVYDYSQRKMDFGEIEDLTSKLSYSQNFKLILKEMLQELPEQRIGILRLKESLSSQSKSQFGHKIDTNLQDSEYKPKSSNKGLIYLGKHPNIVRKSENTQKSAISTIPTHERKNSYHKLLNEKIQSRNKKSVSFSGDFTLCSDISYQDRKSSLAKQKFKETPQTNIDLNRGTAKLLNENHVQDFEENRSDAPISPISLHKHQINEQVNLKKIEFLISKRHDFYEKPLNNANSAQRKNMEVSKQNKMIENQTSQRNQTKSQVTIKPFNNKSFQNHSKTYENSNDLQGHNFQAWIEKEKNKLKQNDTGLNKLNKKPIENERKIIHKPYPGSDFKISQFPSFSLLNKQNIQELQTPRIVTKNQPTPPQSKLKTKSLERYNFPEETPIKSLELIQTQNRQNKYDQSNMKKKTEEQKTFGRYDFSNGALYEGEFNSENEFEGNGVLYFSSGKIFYSGCWKKNQFHGFGILNNIEGQSDPFGQNIAINYKDFNQNDNNLWTQYEGEFYQDKKHGFGTLYFVNGDKFSGCFVNDSIQGFGNFYLKHVSKTIMGIWANNVFRQQ